MFAAAVVVIVLSMDGNIMSKLSFNVQHIVQSDDISSNPCVWCNVQYSWQCMTCDLWFWLRVACLLTARCHKS
jgi:hypothetical protein